MNRSAFRTNYLCQRTTSRRAQTKLETMDTVPATRRAPRAFAIRTRTALSVLCISLLAGVSIAGHAQEKPGAEQTPAKKEATKGTAKKPDAQTGTKAPVRAVVVAAAKKQDAQPPIEPPSTPDATKPAQPPTIDAQPGNAPAPPLPGAVTYSGLVDLYYSINSRAPRAANNGPFSGVTTPSGEQLSIDNAGHFFDVNDRDPSLSLAELNIVRTPNRSLPIGITATLTFGEAARLFHATEPGGTSSYSFLTQLYATYTTRLLGRDIAIDFGKFISPFGLELLESSSNDNYSRAFNFTYGVPFYHVGLRATAPITPTISAQLGVVNGWNNVADDNNGKTVYGQLTWKPTAKLTGILGLIGGPESTGAFGFAKGGSVATTLIDAQAIYQLDAKTKFAAWATYGQGSGEDGNSTHQSGTWLGLVGYVRHQLTPQVAVGLRLEQFEDRNLHFGSPYLRLRDATLTAEYTTLRGRLITRLEYRHDHSNNVQTFGAGVGGTTPDQDTISLSTVYKF